MGIYGVSWLLCISFTGLRTKFERGTSERKP